MRFSYLGFSDSQKRETGRATQSYLIQELIAKRDVGERLSRCALLSAWLLASLLIINVAQMASLD